MTPFIKQQQELAYKQGYRHVDDSDTLPEWYSYSKEDLDTLITQVITNVGEELMRSLNEYELGDVARRSWLKHGKDSWVSIGKDIKQHITSLTGVEK